MKKYKQLPSRKWLSGAVALVLLSGCVVQPAHRHVIVAPPATKTVVVKQAVVVKKPVVVKKVVVH